MYFFAGPSSFLNVIPPKTQTASIYLISGDEAINVHLFTSNVLQASTRFTSDVLHYYHTNSPEEGP